jgi:predicted Zn-dependent protease
LQGGILNSSTTEAVQPKGGEDLHAQLLPQMLELALLAARFDHFAEAAAIAKAVEAIRPENPTPVIIRAMTSVYSGEFEEAARILTEEILAKHPNHSQAKAILGMVQKSLGHEDQARKLLTEVVTDNQVPQAVSLAKALLAD